MWPLFSPGMRSHSPWSREIALVVGLCLIAWWVGESIGVSLWLLVLCLGGWLGWHLYNLRLLIVGLESGGRRLPKATPGLWGEVFRRMRLGSRRGRDHKKQVRRLLSEFSLSAKALPDATVVLNHKFEIQWTNRVARQTLKLPKSDMGKAITALIQYPAFRDWLQNQARNPVMEMEAPADSNRILSLRLVAYGHRQFLLVARDITERERLKAMHEQFVANASHELRTPLAVLQGAIEQMGSSIEIDSELKRPLSWMKRQSDRMQSILEDLLALARLEGHGNSREEWQPIPVYQLLEEICEDSVALSSAPQGHSMVLDVDSQAWVLGQRDSLYALFSNLIVNAVRHSPAGGEIRISWKRPSQGVRFCVSDSGPGIGAHHIPLLTKRFYRVDGGRSRQQGGTGLGLAIVKHVLDLYGVEIEIHSEFGKGASFGFTMAEEFLALPSS